MKLFLSRIPTWLVLLILIAVVYGRSTGFEFVIWDDEELITLNSLVTKGSPWAAWQDDHLGMYIPVTYNLWWLLARAGKAIAGGELPAWPYHTANLLAHFCNALLVASILRTIRLPNWAALFGAAVFTCHPLQVESVVWATAMKDLLSTFFALLSIRAWLQSGKAFSERQAAAGHRWYSLSLVALAMGTLAKPGIFGAPVIAALLDAAFITGWRRAAAWRLAGSLCVLLPAAIITRSAQSFPELQGVGRIFRPTIAAHAIGFYLSKLFAPSRFCIVYGMEPRVVVTQWKHLVVAMLAVLPLVGIFLAKRHRLVLAVSLAVFVLGVLPVLGLVPFVFQALSTVADRYVYLSMLGAAIAAAYAATLLPERTRLLACIAIILALAGAAFKQTGVWRSTLTLMSHCVAVNPEASVAYNNFACAVSPPADLQKWLEQRWRSTTAPSLPRPEVSDELVAIADHYWRLSFGIRPRYVDPLKNMIQTRAVAGRYKEALQLGEYAVAIGPTLGWDAFERVVHPYALAWLNAQVGNRERAIELLRMTVRREPQNVAAVTLLAGLLREEAGATRPVVGDQ